MAEENAHKWEENYTNLHAHARRLVRQFNIPDWCGQEEDVAWDIVQESMRRAYEYTQKAARGEREPVGSLTALLNTVAQNYCRDLRRREWRLNRDLTTTSASFVDRSETRFSEVAIENAYREQLFRLLAHEIAAFPTKQRKALLTDLASRMAFDEKHSTLQRAFLTEGIHLEEYRNPPVQGEKERTRSAALLSHAYKRLRGLADIRAYLDEQA